VAELGFDWGTLTSLLLALGVAIIATGYVILSRGSVTLSPILLVLGYCVLIPASLLIRGRKSASGE
jgi:hypothetical protein